MIGESVGWSNRILRATIAGAYNLAIWVVVQYFLYGMLSQLDETGGSSVSSGNFSLSFIYAFGAAITALEVIGALTQGMAVSVPFASGGYLVSAYYVYAAVSGGTLALETSGLKLAISFEPLLFLLMLPSLFSAIKQPIVFLLERTEAGREASDSV